MPDKSVFQAQLADEEVRRELAEGKFLHEVLNELPSSVTRFEANVNPEEVVDRIADGKTSKFY